MAQQCKKCNGAMLKKMTLNAGNSKYEVYVCKKCGSEEQICRGVLS